MTLRLMGWDTLIKFAIHKSFFQNALVEYIGVSVQTPINKYPDIPSILKILSSMTFIRRATVWSHLPVFEISSHPLAQASKTNKVG